MKKVLSAALGIILLSACGTTPKTPSGTHNNSIYDIGGVWAVKLQPQGQEWQAAGTMTIKQGNHNDFTGSWTDASGSVYTVSGDAGNGDMQMLKTGTQYMVGGTWNFQTDSDFAGNYSIPSTSGPTFSTGKISMTRTSR